MSTAIDQLLGSAAFGAAAIIAAVVANAGQSIELVRAKRIVGVSVLFLILAVVNQGLWLSWAILVPDIGTMIFATVTGIITVFNLTWWSLRVLGLRPLLAAGSHIRDDVTRTYSHSQPAAGRRRAARDHERHRSMDPTPKQRHNLLRCSGGTPFAACSSIKQSVPPVVVMFGQRSPRPIRPTRLEALTLAVLLGSACASTDPKPSASTDPVTPTSTVTPSARRPP
jgi:uncharacterized protein with PQ loop repeat